MPLVQRRSSLSPQYQGIPKLQRIDLLIRICCLVAPILFGLTIALLALTQLGYVPPASGPVTFSALLPLFVIIGRLQSTRQSIAKRYEIPLSDYNKIYYPPPEEKQSQKPLTSPSE